MVNCAITVAICNSVELIIDSQFGFSAHISWCVFFTTSLDRSILSDEYLETSVRPQIYSFIGSEKLSGLSKPRPNMYTAMITLTQGFHPSLCQCNSENQLIYMEWSTISRCWHRSFLQTQVITKCKVQCTFIFKSCQIVVNKLCGKQWRLLNAWSAPFCFNRCQSVIQYVYLAFYRTNVHIRWWVSLCNEVI